MTEFLSLRRHVAVGNDRYSDAWLKLMTSFLEGDERLVQGCLCRRFNEGEQLLVLFELGQLGHDIIEDFWRKDN